MISQDKLREAMGIAVEARKLLHQFEAGLLAETMARRGLRADPRPLQPLALRNLELAVKLAELTDETS